MAAIEDIGVTSLYTFGTLEKKKKHSAKGWFILSKSGVLGDQI